ncbi:MAG: NAD-dependent deacylase [Candidatus Lokiarchaeota archaeon]|nr:NAD-dependent deacylase [Candidatus Lokiarchaeota archaeon]
MNDQEKIFDAALLIKNSSYIVVFSGAGISTESGIDDFRSPGGLWERYDPGIYASYQYFLQDPSLFWTMHKEVEDLVGTADPNQAHLVIAELEKMGKVKAVITQNIDMLHQKAGSGINGANIYQLHGEYGKLHCIKCNKEFNYDEIDTKDVKYPVCECSGYIKPKVVLFGESLPHGVLEGAMNECTNADCLIVVGSSLLVSPANFMPSIAKQYGAKLIFINRENTVMDDLADVFLKGSAGEIFTELLKLVKS